jgi:uncharacterized membrane protein YphA (DoxX/SURF4 family)
MNVVLTGIQMVVALGIFNVWLLRNGKETKWRGGTAKNMKEEFLAYGLPVWFMVCIGIAKVSLAIGLLVGVWIPVITKPAAAALAVLMLGAVAMHMKVKDPVQRALPAIAMFLLSALITLAS